MDADIGLFNLIKAFRFLHVPVNAKVMEQLEIVFMRLSSSLRKKLAAHN